MGDSAPVQADAPRAFVKESPKSEHALTLTLDARSQGVPTLRARVSSSCGDELTLTVSERSQGVSEEWAGVGSLCGDSLTVEPRCESWEGKEGGREGVYGSVYGSAGWN